MQQSMEDLIEENKRLEEELQKTKKSFKELNLIFNTILESTLAGYWDWHIEENYNFMSHNYKKMLGYAPDEVPNDPNWWADNTHPDDVKKFMGSFEEHVKNKGVNPITQELRFYHKNGNVVWVYCRSKVVEWDTNGQPLRMIGCHIDITELKKVTITLNEKNKDLEHFAYIASHDLNEPLRTMDSFIEIIRNEYHDNKDENLSTYFNFIHDAQIRMRKMIDALLSYSRLGKNKAFKQTDLKILVDEIEKDLNYLFKKKNVKLKRTNLPSVNCLAIEIKQVFQNLIINGIKFQKPNVTPDIEISCQERQTHWQFCVSDNGIGISKDKQEAVFQIFTKLHRATEFEGHGIGLAFCKKIVESHKGNIWIESTPNVGSQFYFTISKEL